MTADPAAVFASAAHSFADLVARLPAAGWDGPGLGGWDLRALVGHTSRALVTVSTYLQTTGVREDVTSAAECYVKVTPAALGIDPAAVAERGRQAGRDLGEDPAATVASLAAKALADVDAAADPLIEVIGGFGIRLSNYLPTRTFELADAMRLAADVAVVSGRGVEVLLALTGRAALPPSFSIV